MLSSRPAVRRERGAAAVEFALVATVLFPLLFGLIDYGVYFADVMTTQRAAAQLARASALDGVTQTSACPAGGGGTTGSPVPAEPVAGLLGNPLAGLVCAVPSGVDTILGTAAGRAVLVPGGSNPAKATLWGRPNRVRLCVAVDHQPMLPFVPLPNGGVIEARVDMPIEPPADALLLPVTDVLATATGQEVLPRLQTALGEAWCRP